MVKKVSIIPPVRPELSEGSRDFAIKICNDLLYKTSDFIKKYPEHEKELTPDFTHVLLIPENLVIHEFICLHDILCEYEITKLFIILEKNSSVKIYNKMLKVFAKSLGPSLNSGRTGDSKCVCDIFFLLRDSSSLLFLQEDIGEKIEGKNILSFSLQESSKLEFFMCLAGECETEFNLSVSLLGEHAQANVNGFYLAGKKQKLSLQTEQKHLVRDTFSNLTINGVLADESQVKYCGKIFVEKNAVQVKACQENKNIILGQNVSLQASPELEVLNSNAECKHGCAAGQFDEKQIFYLQSRGFDKNQATQLLIESFFGFINSLDCDIKIKEGLFESIKNKVREYLWI